MKAKTELELALIFIYQINFMSSFYLFVEKFEQVVFIHYLDDIKDHFLSLSYFLNEQKSNRVNLELVKELNQKIK